MMATRPSVNGLDTAALNIAIRPTCKGGVAGSRPNAVHALVMRNARGYHLDRLPGRQLADLSLSPAD